MKTTPLYRSSNGDDWFLALDEGMNQLVVLHRPNAASGGRESRTSVEEFLERGGGGPEHQALRQMMGEAKRRLSEPSAPDALSV